MLIDFNWKPGDVGNVPSGFWLAVDYFQGLESFRGLEEGIMLTGKVFVNECISGGAHVK